MTKNYLPHKDWFYWTLILLSLLIGLRIILPGEGGLGNSSLFVVFGFILVGIFLHHFHLDSQKTRDLLGAAINPYLFILKQLQKNGAKYGNLIKVLIVIIITVYLILPAVSDYLYRKSYCDSKSENLPPLCLIRK